MTNIITKAKPEDFFAIFWSSYVRLKTKVADNMNKLLSNQNLGAMDITIL
jgi:hypothetical protein